MNIQFLEYIAGPLSSYHSILPFPLYFVLDFEISGGQWFLNYCLQMTRAELVSIIYCFASIFFLHLHLPLPVRIPRQFLPLRLLQIEVIHSSLIVHSLQPGHSSLVNATDRTSPTGAATPIPSTSYPLTPYSLFVFIFVDFDNSTES